MNTDMLTCEEALERMSQALDGPLPLEERQALEEHLESCPECRTAYEALFQMEDALREIGETPRSGGAVCPGDGADPGGGGPGPPARSPLEPGRMAEPCRVGRLCGPLPGTLARGRFGEP